MMEYPKHVPDLCLRTYGAHMLPLVHPHRKNVSNVLYIKLYTGWMSARTALAENKGVRDRERRVVNEMANNGRFWIYGRLYVMRSSRIIFFTLNDL